MDFNTDGDGSFTWDNNGNTITAVQDGLTTTYGYDPENRLVTATTPDAILGYAYNADGIRVQSVVNGAATDFLVDHNRPYAQVLEEVDEAGALQVAYIHGDDLLSQHRVDGPHYYHVDGHGSTTALTDSDGVVSDSYLYDAWCVQLDGTGDTENSYLYTGEQYDDGLGFYYLRARYYQPKAARFSTQDKWTGRELNPVTLHKYVYANGNPISYIDPSGYFSIIGLTQVSSYSDMLVAIRSEGLRRFVKRRFRKPLYRIHFGKAPTVCSLPSHWFIHANIKGKKGFTYDFGVSNVRGYLRKGGFSRYFGVFDGQMEKTREHYSVAKARSFFLKKITTLSTIHFFYGICQLSHWFLQILTSPTMYPSFRVLKIVINGLRKQLPQPCCTI